MFIGLESLYEAFQTCDAVAEERQLKTDSFCPSMPATVGPGSCPFSVIHIRCISLTFNMQINLILINAILYDKFKDPLQNQILRIAGCHWC